MIILFLVGSSCGCEVILRVEFSEMDVGVHRRWCAAGGKFPHGAGPKARKKRRGAKSSRTVERCQPDWCPLAVTSAGRPRIMSMSGNVWTGVPSAGAAGVCSVRFAAGRRDRRLGRSEHAHTGPDARSRARPACQNARGNRRAAGYKSGGDPACSRWFLPNSRRSGLPEGLSVLRRISLLTVDGLRARSCAIAGPCVRHAAGL